MIIGYPLPDEDELRLSNPDVSSDPGNPQDESGGDPLSSVPEALLEDDVMQPDA